MANTGGASADVPDVSFASRKPRGVGEVGIGGGERGAPRFGSPFNASDMTGDPHMV